MSPVLAAADPAQPYGAGPCRRERARGSRRRCLRRPHRRRGGPLRGAWRQDARSAARSGSGRPAARCARRACEVGAGRSGLAVERFDGEPVGETDAMPLLVEAGFVAGHAAPCCGRSRYHRQNLDRTSLPARVCRQGARQRRHEVARRAPLAERPAPLTLAGAPRRGLRLPRRCRHPGLSDVEQHGAVRHASGFAAAGLPPADRRVRGRAGATGRRRAASVSGSPPIRASTRCSAPRSRDREGAAGRRAGRAAARCARDGPRPSS